MTVYPNYKTSIFNSESYLRGFIYPEDITLSKQNVVTTIFEKTKKTLTEDDSYVRNLREMIQAYQKIVEVETPPETCKK